MEARQRSVNQLLTLVAVLALLSVALYLRTLRLNWDENHHLHPDERFLVMVGEAVEWPANFRQYLDTASSPLSPYNRGYADFFYGTLPLFLTRYVGQWASQACADPPALLPLAFVRLLRPAAEVCNWGPYTSYDNVPLVGRFLAALADIGALVFIFLIGRRLYDARVGILALALGTLAVFPIQHSHFFAVDNFATLFVMAALYFSVRAVQMGRWQDFALAGLAGGLALACKMSTWPIGLIIGLAALCYITLTPRESRRWGTIGLLSRVCLAAVLFFVAFRLAHPYSFMGPGFFGLRLNPQWLEDMREIRRLTNTGEAEIPYAQQWAGRTPVLFSLINMVVWGLGLPLGITAWAGWAVAGIEILRGRWKHLVLWAWSTVFFLYQSTLWFKTMRYILPVYHVFILFGAYALWRLGDWALKHKGVRRAALALPAFVLLGTLLWALAFVQIYRVPHTRIAASRWIYENVPAESVIANEHWDDGLPLSLPDYSVHYRWLSTSSDGQMRNYEDDTPWKRDQLYAWLDEADYVLITSNRLYASIPRLRARYPLTTEYYRALFAGELGFELVADFSVYPRLGPVQFPDQENPFLIMAAAYVYQPVQVAFRLPPAEEAFSVYDHPRVLIFRKTSSYSRERVEAILGRVDLSKAMIGLRTVNADKAQRLIFDDPTWTQQREGGTWAGIFDRGSLLNVYPGLAAVVWWLVVTAAGWLAFPLLYVALPRLRDRGYGVSRILALLLVAYLTWLVASLRILPNTRLTVVRMVLVLAIAGGWAAWSKWGELKGFVRRRWKDLVLVEVLFVVLYAGWIGVRLAHPDLWHPHMGGEKPMDLAYLNAVIKSTWFPPYNPWFAGFAVNYYYFGFVIVGSWIKLLGTDPAIAYNLVVPLLYALTGVGAFSVAYNLFGGHRRGAILAGVMALLFTVVLGNLGEINLLWRAFAGIGMAGGTCSHSIPGLSSLIHVLRGLFKVLFTPETLPLEPGDSAWYWHATRIIPSAAGDPISEFPAFTFLYGDLHAHAIALPLTLLALTLAVYWARTSRPHWASLLLGGLVIGALYPTNTWDYPTYLLLGLAGLALGILLRRREPLAARLETLAWRALLLVGLTVLCCLPYLRNYAAGYRSFEKWPGSYTPLGSYLLIHTILLFPVVTFLVVEMRRLLMRLKRAGRFPLHLSLSFGLALDRMGQEGRAWHSYGQLRIDFMSLLVIALIPAVALVLSGYAVALVTVPLSLAALLASVLPHQRRMRRFLWLMVALAMVLCLAVEIVVLKGDVGRMNTVFKFYLQIWVMLAIVAGVSLAWVSAYIRRWQRLWRRLWWFGMGLLLAAGALYLPLGIRARAVDRISSQTGATLDGMAFMQYAAVRGDLEQTVEIPLAGDYYAIRWMQEHISGSPVIMEGLGQREYLWANRVSIYTGLPAVVGWRWHEVQQYTVLPEDVIERRRSDVNEFYSTDNIQRAKELLARYDVQYVYVGDYERAYYNPMGLAKFDAMVAQGELEVVYDALGVKVYRVIGR